MEPFIYLALFLLVAVASLVFRWLRAQIEVAPTDRLDTGPWAAPHRPAKVISATPPPATRDAAPPPHPSPLRRRHPARLAARGGVRDLRRGMVWMTILGPCRGLAPPGRVAAATTDSEPRVRP